MNIFKCFLCVSLMKLPITFAQESAINHTDYLLYDLLLDYDLYMRPVIHVNTTVNISTSLHLVSLKTYDEMEGTFSFIAILAMEWTDIRMVWDPLYNGGVDFITVGYDKVWVPDLYCVNSASNFMPVGTAKERIGFYETGLAMFAPGALFDVTCEGNMERYPFDSQTCHISFNAWNYRKGEVSLVPASNVIDIQSLDNNNMWSVVDTRVGHILNPDGVQLDFFIEIKRKSKFITVNVVVPLVLLSCLNNLVFLLVPESGERISLCITVLLSISVYLTILNNSLPQTSEPVPIISYKIIADLAVSYLNMLMVVINLKIYHKSVKERVPQQVKNVYKFLTCTCNKAKGKLPINFQDMETISNDYIHNLGRSEDSSIKASLSDDTENDKITWRHVSALLDIVCLIVFNFVSFCSVFIFLLMTYF